jgi:nucleoside-diphosphate-sugar epimerase
MTYQIHGAQGFAISVKTAAEALTHALAAQKSFPPIRIVGPDGETTVNALRLLIETERNNSD